MGGTRVEIAWSKEALRDLDRFAAFLDERDPRLAATIAKSISRKVNLLASSPRIGRPVGDSFRQVVLVVARAPYVIQYHFGQARVTILRVYHGREDFDRP